MAKKTSKGRGRRRYRGINRVGPGTQPNRVYVPHGPPPAVAELTQRELEVLRLVARGLSNTEIAKELFLSQATVKTHLAHVMQKLDLRDRVQAVVLAYESGLVRPGAED